MYIAKNTSFSLIITVREFLCLDILMCSDVGSPTYIKLIDFAYNYPQVNAGE